MNDDLITLNLVENHRVVRRYAFSFEALQLAPHYSAIIDDALAAWMSKHPSRRVFAQFEGMTHIVSVAHG